MPYVPVELLPVTEKPLQSSVMLPAVTLKQVLPFIATDWFSV
jgi:hypothetical protein